jgi:membrane protein YdbS with pleckstrin-like domain
MRDRTDHSVYERQPTDPWVKAGIAGGLLYLFRRPVWLVSIALLLAFSVGMMGWPSQTALVLAAVVGLGIVHHVRRRKYRR